jgi:hypothetical protein
LEPDTDAEIRLAGLDVLAKRFKETLVREMGDCRLKCANTWEYKFLEE